MLWEELRQDEFRAAVEKSRGVCVLPIGCVEAHGIHLPLGCDVMHVVHHCKLAAEREAVVIFPPLYFGEKAGAGEYPGTIIFPESLILEILEQCCKEIHRNGFRKILVVNGHGGNNAMLTNFAWSAALKTGLCPVFVYSSSLKSSYPKVLLANIEKYPYLTGEDIEVLEAYGDKTGGHGCFTETGWMLNARPELTRVDLMKERDGTSRHLFDGFSELGIFSAFTWQGNFPDSLHGDYHEGLNERIARAMTEAHIEALTKVFGFLKTEKVSQKYYEEWEKKNPLL